MTVLLYFFAGLCLIVGVVGTIMPLLPGAPLVFTGVVIIGAASKFSIVGWGSISVCLILTVLAVVVDFVASALGAKRVGASWFAVVGATIGSIIGILWGIVGVFFMPFVGAVLGEMIARRDLVRAGKVGLGTWLGFIVGIAAKLALVVSMLGVLGLALAF